MANMKTSSICDESKKHPSTKGTGGPVALPLLFDRVAMPFLRHLVAVQTTFTWGATHKQLSKTMKVPSYPKPEHRSHQITYYRWCLRVSGLGI